MEKMCLHLGIRQLISIRQCFSTPQRGRKNLVLLKGAELTVLRFSTWLNNKTRELQKCKPSVLGARTEGQYLTPYHS